MMSKTYTFLVIVSAALTSEAWPPGGGGATSSPFRASTLVGPRSAGGSDLCTLESGKQGHCVHSYLCVGGMINTDGGDLTDERSIECEAPKVCCFLNESIKETTTTQKTSTLVPGVVTPPSGPGGHCTAFDNSSGRCVYPHLCTNDTTIMDGSDLLDERSSDPCPNWRGAIQICCPAEFLKGKIDDEPTTTPATDSRNKDEVAPCTTRFSGLGSCVPFYQCTNTDDDGASIINVRYDPNSQCKYTQTCCAVEYVDRTKTPPTPPPPTTCGMANPSGLVYKGISGNINEAKYGEFPWMVAVRTRAGPEHDNYNISGGTIIHPWVVLTAAHYVVRALDQDVRVRAGEWDILSTDEPLPHQELAVRKILPHPEFNNRNKHNDIALLFLSSRLALVPHIGVACLPAARAAPSTDCVATGWGKDRFGEKGRVQSILKKTILPVMPREECQSRLRGTRLGPFFKLHEGFMCAGGERLDTCTQDGGGPLACPLENEPNRYTVSGIVSWGIGCGQDGLPGVYADTYHYASWLRAQAAAEGYDLNNYAL